MPFDRHHLYTLPALLSESGFQRILLLAFGGCVGNAEGRWVKGDSESRVRARCSPTARTSFPGRGLRDRYKLPLSFYLNADCPNEAEELAGDCDYHLGLGFAARH